ncbi:hypothetical protein E1A91_A01G252200v1 [Gossypium mustelinum]|uniref:PARG catalytic Macro domain-containing protein n=1 Tax=Gossypium mustelinum TaxID=34275 RepID=A0A5D3AHI5_GOSMU|nr:hypothetical protein E1A91_A01G252200v1 [Gossypium mustelinum]
MLIFGPINYPLCPFQVHSSGLIEDHAIEALEVDFANKYLGGGALHRGCVQEEIRFMINPELIAGMLFLPSMADNEAIEIVGAERFSDYTGYASSFRFSGDYVDKRSVDFLGRRKTRIVAIDALCSPRMKQYKLKYLIRETNKAFCGFLDQSKYSQYKRIFKMNSVQLNEGSSLPIKAKGESRTEEVRKSDEKSWRLEDCENYIGIATGNWGCGAFGGDPEVKTIIQWLAASQALRPFISYYTFGLEALQSLAQVLLVLVKSRSVIVDKICIQGIVMAHYHGSLICSLATLNSTVCWVSEVHLSQSVLG